MGRLTNTAVWKPVHTFVDMHPKGILALLACVFTLGRPVAAQEGVSPMPLPTPPEVIENEQGPVHTVVEQEPEFPGGQGTMMAHISRNVRYPEMAVEEGIQGKCFISFVVEPDGQITDVKVERGVHPYLDREALRVVQDMPRWKPGFQDGKPVRVRYNLPVVFKLQD